MSQHVNLFYSILIFFPLSLGIIYLINHLYERKQKLQGRINKLLIHTGASHEQHTVSRKAATKKSLIERKLKHYFLRNPKKVEKFTLWLYQSDLKVGIRGITVAFALIWSLSVIVLILLLRLNVLLILTGVFLAQLMLFYLFIQLKVKRQKSKIVEELAHAVDIIARGIKAGSTIEKTFPVVAREIKPPLQGEFIRISHELEFGIPFEDVIHSAAHRINIPDFFFFASALVLQRKSGGSLSEVLENIVTMLHKAKEIRMKVRVFSAESKGSAVVLTSIPLVVWLIMLTVQADYLQFFLLDPLGKKLLILVFGLVIATVITVSRITKIEA